MGPEIIIRNKKEPTPRPVRFEELSSLVDGLQSITLLWNCNSYLVNVDRRCFIINGGRRIGVNPIFKDCRDLKLFYRRRTQMDLTVGSDNGGDNRRVSYLLGFSGVVNGEEKFMFIQVTDDGSQWVWRDHK